MLEPPPRVRFLLLILAALGLSSCQMLDDIFGVKSGLQEPLPEAPILHAESENGAIVLTWSAGSIPQFKPVRMLRLLCSEEGPASGFRVIATPTVGVFADTFRVTGLRNTIPYYFRLAGYTNPTELSFTSAPVVSTPGAFATPVDTVGVSGLVLNSADPDWSRDGNWIGFAEALGYGLTRIMAWSPVTRELRQIAQFDTVDWAGNVRWSPSGNSVAFTLEPSLYGYRSRVWIAPLDGGSPAHSVSTGEFDAEPAWDRSDSAIVFTRRNSNGNTDPTLWRVDLRDASERKLEPNAFLPSIRASDGSIIYNAQGSDAGVAAFEVLGPSSGTPSRFLAHLGWFDYGARWSPDGHRVLFLSNRTGNWEIWVADYPAGTIRQVTAGGGITARTVPCWSANGDRIATIEGPPSGGVRIGIYGPMAVVP